MLIPAASTELQRRLQGRGTRRIKPPAGGCLGLCEGTLEAVRGAGLELELCPQF